MRLNFLHMPQSKQHIATHYRSIYKNPAIFYLVRLLRGFQKCTTMLLFFSWGEHSYRCHIYIVANWTMNFQMFKLVLEKAEEPEIKLTTSAGSWKKQERSRKTSISALLTMPKTLTVWITINCGKFWKRWEYQATWPASWEICMQARKQQLELDMEQQTGSK